MASDRAHGWQNRATRGEWGGYLTWLVMTGAALLVFVAACAGPGAARGEELSWLTGSDFAQLEASAEMMHTTSISIIDSDLLIHDEPIITTHHGGPWDIGCPAVPFTPDHTKTIYLVASRLKPYWFDVSGTVIRLTGSDLGRGTRTRPWIADTVYVAEGVRVIVVTLDGLEVERKGVGR